jgi:hypothetical protein
MRHQRMGESVSGHGGREAVAVDRQRAAGRHLWRRPRMISEPATHLGMQHADGIGLASSERKELEQTSSARLSVLMRLGAAPRAHLVQHHRHAACASCQAASLPARPPPTT